MSKQFHIEKTNDEQNLVFGWASVGITKSGQVVEDYQGDIVDMESLEQVMYDFVLKYRDANIEHDGPTVGNLVECVVFTKAKMAAMGIPEGIVPEGVWLGFKVNDATFEKVKSGDLEMFSIEGTGQRLEV